MNATGTAANRMERALRIVAYFLVVLAPLILAAAGGDLAGAGTARIAGRAAALLGFSLLLLQPVLSSRWGWIERPFGLDRVLRFHRATGAVGAALLLAHPFLLALASGSLRLLTSMDLPWYLVVGRAALLVLVLFALGALLHRALRLPFQWWMRAHNAFTPVVIAGAVAHSWAIHASFGSTVTRLLWIALGALSLFAYLHLTLYRRLRCRFRPYRVTSVKSDARGVWRLLLEPPGGRRRFQYLPGQFAFITLIRGRGLPAEEHPFTLASSPAGGPCLEIAPKELGDFTATIGETRPGDRVAVMAPFGRFSPLLHADHPGLVMIAGGIGITPMMSMIRYLRDRGVERRVQLVYGNRTEDDIAFRSELERIAAGENPPELELTHVLSSPGPGWDGARGYVDRKLLRGLVENPRETAFYICGPPIMMRSVEAALLGMGARGDDIHSERFSL